MNRQTLIVAGCLLVVVIAAVYVYVSSDVPDNNGIEPEPAANAAEPESPGDSLQATIELPPQKLAVAGVSLSEVTTQTLRPENLVPGRLQYDDRHHVEIRSATAGIITDIPVKPGVTVKAGDVLVELNSPEVGNARADLLQRTSDLKLAEENRDWQKATCEGLQKLAQAIRDRHPVDQIRAEFRQIILGKSRDQLLSAYSDLLLAESLAAAAETSVRSGAMPARTLEERINNRDTAESTLLSNIEEQSFEATQRCRQAEAEVANAERRARISLQTVRTLLGKTAELMSGGGVLSTAESDPDIQSDSLSIVQLRAPFSGTIERRMFSPSERIEPGDALLLLADTSTLWVAADLREREWSALSLKTGDEIQVMTSVPGMPSCQATVHFVGREVDPMTNAVPLVAILDNSAGRLRPGMFVRVAVPVADARRALAIPESSVLEHDRQAFVFTPDGDSRFRRVNITPGIHTAGLVEVLSGLENGIQVVSKGGFYLKSELLLQGESE